MERVRTAAHVSGSQISHYFDDKQSLLRAVLEHQIESIMANHQLPEVSDLGSWDHWENWIELNLRHLRNFGYSARPTYHGLAGQLVKSDQSMRETVANGYQRWIEFFENRLDRMKAQGVLIPAADPHLLALIVTGGHQGGCLLSFTYRQAWPLASALRFIVNHLRGFASDPTERVARTPRLRWARTDFSARVATNEVGFLPTTKGMATRERIVNGAADLMFLKGVRRTSLEDVRSAARVSGSQLGHYFDDKSDLTRRVIEARASAMDAFLAQPRLGGLASLDALKAWANACIEDSEPVHLRGGCPYGSLVSEVLEYDRNLADDLARGYDAVLERFRAGLEGAKLAGDIGPNSDVDHLAAVLLAAHQGGTMLTFTTGSVQPCSELIRAAIDYVAAQR